VRYIHDFECSLYHLIYFPTQESEVVASACKSIQDPKEHSDTGQCLLHTVMGVGINPIYCRLRISRLFLHK
jgi:hypothetical protein